MFKYLQRYRSGHNGADSKSVCGKPHEGSNPSLSAKTLSVVTITADNFLLLLSVLTAFLTDFEIMIDSLAILFSPKKGEFRRELFLERKFSVPCGSNAYCILRFDYSIFSGIPRLSIMAPAEFSFDE